MHYLNGREAKEGDHVIARKLKWTGTDYKPGAGVIHTLVAGSDTCNAQVAYPSMIGMQNQCVTVSDCLHVEDAMAPYDAEMAKPTETKELPAPAQAEPAQSV